jgi:hypothetical protein
MALFGSRQGEHLPARDKVADDAGEAATTAIADVESNMRQIAAGDAEQDAQPAEAFARPDWRTRLHSAR